MRKLVIGLFTVLAVFAFSVHTLSAQATDTAQLNLTGQVPSLVRIGFGSLVADTESHDFGDLTEASSFTTTLNYLANVSFSINASSVNNGVLSLDGAGDGFGDTVGYSLSWDGATVDLSSGSVDVVSGVARGIGSFSLAVDVDAVSLDGFDDDTTIDEVPAQGTYTDSITFTITADE